MALIDRKMAEESEQRMMAADSSKLGKVRSAFTCFEGDERCPGKKIR